MTDAERVRILAVEDNAGNVALLKAILRRAADERLRDADLVVASTQKAARDALANEGFDAVLLDMRLPDGNGLDVIPLVRTRARPTPVIVLSANALAADEAAARAAGADEYIPKPYDPTALLTLLSRFIDAR